LCLIRLNWSKARFTYENGVASTADGLQYILEMDLLGNLFSNPVTVVSTNLLYADIRSVQLNDLIKGFTGSDVLDAQYAEFRVKVEYDGAAEPLYSNAVTLGAELYTGEPPEPEPADEIMIRWKQVEGDWTAFAVYAYGAAEVFGGWPGKTVTPNENGWCTVIIPGDRPVNLILNNNGGGSQFDFLADPTESGSYEINTAAGTFTKVDNPAEDITIRWKYTGSDWTTFGIYAWGGSPAGETFGGWPGATPAPDGDGWCEVVVPAGQTVGNVIFNNGSGGDGGQFDVKLNIIASVCFEITDDAYTVVDCNATDTPELADEVMLQWKQVTGSWTEFAVYAWGDAEVYGDWPGKVVSPNGSGWYSAVVPGNRPVNLILNNNGNGSQFDFLADPTESGSYEINTAAGTFTKVDNPAEDITIHWKYTGSDWTTFGIYAWGGWPGATPAPDGSGWCEVVVPAGQTVGNVIFNNGSGGDGNQFDVHLEIISSVCFEITSSSYTVVDCQ
jgi:hypothetical protein